jgi:predicted Zn-dependent peptidase
VNKVFETPPSYNKTVLSSGVRVVSEHHPFTRSTSVGLFIPLGSRDETHSFMGAAHFIEHMAFKGTKTKSAFDIAASIEAVGGDLNAFTSKEYTCFHATTLREHLSLSLDVLTDILTNATFQVDEFEKERQVILSEVDMSADDPQEYIFDLYLESVFKGHPLSQPILGTAASLNGLSRKNLYDYYKGHYASSDVIVSVAGNVDHDEAVELVQKILGKAKVDKRQPLPRRKKPKTYGFQEFRFKNSEQVHILIGQKSSSYRDATRFEAYIANAVLGGGMTSRLYQKIREKKALAYSVYSYLHSFTDSGLSMVYAGTAPEHAKKAIRMIKQEYLNLLEKGLTKKELNFFKRQVIGTILLGADDIENRMSSLGVNEMVFGEYRPVDRVIEEIEGVTASSMQDFFQKNIDSKSFGTYILGELEPKAAAELFLVEP